MTNYLTPSEWAKAVAMWHSGCDTLQIANRLHAPEPLIYRYLPGCRLKQAVLEQRRISA